MESHLGGPIILTKIIDKKDEYDAKDKVKKVKVCKNCIPTGLRSQITKFNIGKRP
jgi:hypothetical protein